ncbi:MAG: tripartite tricarboxylate transporter substrate binding protein [Alicyclobacillus sp.]|nr:tripartite tricarboxylate transporter substrate binding protein [Alicyclobacillus sp.]
MFQFFKKRIFWGLAVATTTVALVGCSMPQVSSPVAVQGNARTDTYPTKPLTFLVAYSMGGGVDTAARQIAPEVQKVLGQKILIENVPGASGVIATNQFVNDKADGYTILIHGMPSINLSTLLFADQARYKMSDLIPIASWVNADGNALVVPKNSPINNLKQFIQAAKKKQLSVATGGGVGSTDHATLVTLEHVAHIKLNMVPFNSAGDAATAVIGGHVDAGFVSLTSSTVSAQNFKFLAVTTEKRVSGFSNVPTFAELGYPQMTLAFHVGAFAKKGTPLPVLKKLEAAFRTAFYSKSYQNWAKNAGKPIGDFEGMKAFGKATANATKTMKAILPMMQADMKAAGQ